MTARDILLQHNGEGVRVVLPDITTLTVPLWQVGRFVDEFTKFTIYGKPARVLNGNLQIEGDVGFTAFQGSTNKMVEIAVDRSIEWLVPKGSTIYERDGKWYYMHCSVGEVELFANQ